MCSELKASGASSSLVPSLCHGGLLPRMGRVFHSWLSSDSVKQNRAPLASESAPALCPFYLCPFYL